MPTVTTKSDEPQPLIKWAEPDFAAHTVKLYWVSGAQTIADFSDVVGEGVFLSFIDPAFFNGVKVAEGGQFLSWPNGIEYAAISLWDSATPPGKQPRPIKSPATPRNVLVLGG
jgi:hypothetical protein